MVNEAVWLMRQTVIPQLKLLPANRSRYKLEKVTRYSLFYTSLTKFTHNRHMPRCVNAVRLRLLSESHMRLNQLLLSIAALVAASIFFITVIIYSPVSAVAGSLTGAAGKSHLAHAPKTRRKSQRPAAREKIPAWPEAKVVIARPHLDLSDEVATLKALQLALSEVGDGSSYVWHRSNGRLSGIIKPTMSFRDAQGKVCRHLEVWLTAGTVTKKTESIACRLANRVWKFEG